MYLYRNKFTTLIVTFTRRDSGSILKFEFNITTCDPMQRYPERKKRLISSKIIVIISKANCNSRRSNEKVVLEIYKVTDTLLQRLLWK